MVMRVRLRALALVVGRLYSEGHYFELSALYKLLYIQTRYPLLNILAIQNKEMS